VEKKQKVVFDTTEEESPVVVTSERAEREFLPHHHGYRQGIVKICTKRGWWYSKLDMRMARRAAVLLYIAFPPRHLHLERGFQLC